AHPGSEIFLPRRLRRYSSILGAKCCQIPVQRTRLTRQAKTSYDARGYFYVAIPYGKYLLDRKLTEGGMAEIFLARPNPLLAPPELTARRGPIVVKRLFAHHSSEAEFVRMFFNEARLAARIRHPNIVEIFDQGESDGTYFLAME